jgi:hypothetical protein
MSEIRHEDVLATRSSRRRFIAAGAGAAAAAVVATGSARADSDQGLVGSWFLTIDATEPPLGVFNALISFHAGGVVTEARRYYVPGRSARFWRRPATARGRRSATAGMRRSSAS